jgi:DNA-binding ferritin-like protein
LFIISYHRQNQTTTTVVGTKKKRKEKQVTLTLGFMLTSSWEGYQIGAKLAAKSASLIDKLIDTLKVKCLSTWMISNEEFERLNISEGKYNEGYLSPAEVIFLDNKFKKIIQDHNMIVKSLYMSREGLEEGDETSQNLAKNFSLELEKALKKVQDVHNQVNTLVNDRRVLAYSSLKERIRNKSGSSSFMEKIKVANESELRAIINSRILGCTYPLFFKEDGNGHYLLVDTKKEKILHLDHLEWVCQAAQLTWVPKKEPKKE